MSATAAMPAHPHAASTTVAAELWISLASLLRSHVAMHGIAQPGIRLRILSTSSSVLELLGPKGKLTVLQPDIFAASAVEFRPETGELGDEYSTFFFTEEGLLHWEDSGVAVDMEAAVEHWLRKVQA